MKWFQVIMLVIVGLAAGWLLPSAVSPASRGLDKPSVLENVRNDRNHARIKEELLGVLLEYFEQDRYKRDSASTLSELLPQIRSGNFGDSAIDRVIDMDPLAAMSQLLADPSASSKLCEEIAAAWVRRDPEAALRFLRSQTSYRGQDSLYRAMVAAYPAGPERVAEIFKTLPRHWQVLHVKDFFSQTWNVRATGAPPEAPSNDPFANDGHWVTIRPGKEILECLADDRLRELARISQESSVPIPESPEKEKPEELNVAAFDGNDYGRFDLLREHLVSDRENTIKRVAESGNYQARSDLMAILIGEFPMDSKAFTQALGDVEILIERLGVFPAYPPSHFEMGPFLYGQDAAAWITRQPAALQRAWAPTFVETWVVREPQKAVEWALTLPVNLVRDEAFQSGIVIWAHQEPLAAATYVAALPVGGIREAAISNAAAAWSCTDRAGAKAWLDSLPSSSGKDRGLERAK